MRIIAGMAKGHRIKSIKGNLTRPTLDRVREAVFNILQNKIIDAKVLDLFAGTGAIGIEALSRGARFCVFNDIHKEANEIIKQNINYCNFSKKAHLYQMDAFHLLEVLVANEKEPFDFVYLDPPYQENYYEKLLTYLGEWNLLLNGSIVVVESKIDTKLAEHYGTLVLIKEKIYGNTLISIYKDER